MIDLNIAAAPGHAGLFLYLYDLHNLSKHSIYFCTSIHCIQGMIGMRLCIHNGVVFNVLLGNTFAKDLALLLSNVFMTQKSSCFAFATNSTHP